MGNLVEGPDYLGLERVFDGGERERVLHIVVVEIAFAGRSLCLDLLAITALGRSLERGRRRGRSGRGRRLRQRRGAAGTCPCCRDRLTVRADHRRRPGLGGGT